MKANIYVYNTNEYKTVDSFNTIAFKDAKKLKTIKDISIGLYTP